MKQGIVSIILSCIIFLVAVISLVLLLQLNNGKKVDNTQITNKNDIQWKKYVNKYSKYEISIPPDWLIEDVYARHIPGVILSSPDKKILIFTPNDLRAFAGTNELAGKFYLDVVNLPDILVGEYYAKSSYQEYSTHSGETAYRMTINTNDIAHPDNNTVPFFGVIFRDNLEPNYQTVKEILKTFVITGTHEPINNLISYKVPENWLPGKHDFTYQSPDFEQGSIVTTQQGVLISIDSNLILPGDTLESERSNWENTAGVTKIVETTIDSLPAILIQSNWENSRIGRYYVVKGKKGFTINISASLENENKYQKQISEFIDSIKFN